MPAARTTSAGSCTAEPPERVISSTALLRSASDRAVATTLAPLSANIREVALEVDELFDDLTPTRFAGTERRGQPVRLPIAIPGMVEAGVPVPGARRSSGVDALQVGDDLLDRLVQLYRSSP
jgi:hypothetical protein